MSKLTVTNIAAKLKSELAAASWTGPTSDSQPLRICLFNTVTSTMEAARNPEAALEILEVLIPAWPSVTAQPGVTIALALEQTSGRGRFDRRWVSEPGMGIYLTALFQTETPLSSLPTLSLAAGLAAVGAVRELGAPGMLKWPNDVLIRDVQGWRKIAGVLVETSAAGAGKTSVAVGIGLNRIADTSAAAVGGISLSETVGREIGYNQAALALIGTLCFELGIFFNRTLAELYQGPVEQFKRWQDSSMVEGVPVKVTLNGAKHRAMACGLDATGALVVEVEGQRISLISGEVEMLDAASI